MLINVLTNNSCPNSRAFNFPLLASKCYFKDEGITLKFFWKISEPCLNCDVLLINSNVFRTFWQAKKSDIFNFLDKARSRKIKIYWFDTTDSTWCTQFEVMPFVDKFLKGQILADKKTYLQRFRTGRIYTDFFDELYASGEKDEAYPLPSENDLVKMDISWNTCFENYSEGRFSISGKARHFLRPFTANFAKEAIRVGWTAPGKERMMRISCRVGRSHSRPSVADHRKAIIELLSKRSVGCGKISLPEYFSELRNSQIAVSPFGVGEITLRDFEIIICGAALVKPDMSHLKTWPDLYQPDKTYVSHKWDLSDFDAKLDYLQENPEKAVDLAAGAQDIYRMHLSAEGLEDFSKRLIKIVK